MQNVAPTHRLNRRSRDFLIAAAAVFLIGAALAVAGIGLHIVSLVVPFNRGFAIYDLTRKALVSLGFGLSFVSMLMALRAVTWKTDHSLAWELGELLAGELDRQFVFIRNVSKRSLGTIDAALVSRHGVLVLRISKRKGEYYNVGGDWLRRRRNGSWRPLRWNPTRDVVADAMRVKAFLKDYDLSAAPVFAAVVFTRAAPDVQFSLRDPAVPVLNAQALINGLSDSYFAEDRLNAATVQRVVNLLYH
ncbi:MAG: nuclease-related domain-containing protein [Chloroflexota bacterium]|nr:nuclease-related domain-containing protein [Chloroflexota bacterium]MDE2910743.1 nuclease-related domain-containing protein [Chloroflexota bacterium]